MSSENKHKSIQRNEKVWLITELNRKCSEETQTLDLLDNTFKFTILNMLKDLKETVNKEIKETEDNVSLSREYS